MALLEKSVGRRNFLKGTAAAAAAVAGAGLAGCSPGTKEESLSNTGADVKPHVVESDTAINEGAGKWVAAECWGNCGGRCLNKVYVVDGVVVRQKTDDFQDDTVETPQMRSCPRGHSLRQHIFGINRLKYPLKRKSWQPGGGENSHGDKRGIDEWERISWDEALDYIASELKRVYDSYGPRSVVNMGQEWNLLNLLGGRCQWNGTESYGNWFNAPIRIGTSVENGEYPNGMMANDRLDLQNADTIVLYGTNQGWHSAGNPAYYIRLAKEAGAEFISVGPDYNVTAAMMDAKWIRVRPGTDTVFLLAVAYEMLRLDEEKGGIVDWNFLHKYCVGFDSESMPEDAKLNENFKDYVLGAYDNTPKTPEWASLICGTPTEDITWFAEKLGKKDNVTLMHSYAPARYKGSIDLNQMMMTITCMGGHMGRPGNACGSSFNIESANGGPHLVTWGNVSLASSIPNPLQDPYICKPEIWKCILEGKYTCRGAYNGHYTDPEVDNAFLMPQKEYEFDPKIIVSDFHNPLQATEDINLGIQAFRKMELVVEIDYHFTLTGQYADIILPCLSPWEGNLDKSQGDLELSTTGTLRISKKTNRDMILALQPVVLPMYENKNETWIHTEIMKRLGLDPKEVFPISDIQAYYDKFAGATVVDEDGVTYKTLVTITQEDIDAWGVDGKPQEGVITLKEFLERGIYTMPRRSDDNLTHIAYKEFIEDPEANPRNTVSGKMEIYCQSKADQINAIGYAKEPLKPYPTYHVTTYEESFSDFEGQQKSDYPFIMYQPHYLRRAHTNFDNNTWTREAFQNPVFVNSQDAQEKGIQDGDTVLIFNETGKVLRKASVLETLVPGCIALPHGSRSYIDPESGIDYGGNENMLISAYHSQDPFFPQSDCYNSCLVDFELYDGDPIPDDVEKEPVMWTEA